MKWLHISDIHFNYCNYSTKKMRDKIIESIKKIYKDIIFDCVFITGDIAFKGGAYTKEVTNFIQSIAKNGLVNKENIFIIPGNHDLKRSTLRERVINDIVKSNNQTKELEKIDKDSMDVLQKGQDGFWKFYKKITGNAYNKKNIHFIDKRDKFNIININTCLLCGRKREEGELSIFIDKLYDVVHNNLEKDKVNIAIGHHSIECFCQEERNKIVNTLVDAGVDLYLCGHSHKPKISIDNNNDRDFYVVVAGAGVVDDYATPTYLIGSVEDRKCTITYYSWDNQDEVWSKETKGLGRKVKDGVCNFELRNEICVTKDEKDIFIEEDEFKEFLIEFHENIDSTSIGNTLLVQEEIEKKFLNMKCNKTVRTQFKLCSKYFPIIDDIINDDVCLGMDKRLAIPNAIYEEYNNVLHKHNTGEEILESIVLNIYSRYRDKIKYSESKLKLYIKTLVFWLINECDIYDDVKE